MGGLKDGLFRVAYQVEIEGVVKTWPIKAKRKGERSEMAKTFRFLIGIKLRISYLKNWSGWPGSNRRPCGPKPHTLPTELHPDRMICILKEII